MNELKLQKRYAQSLFDLAKQMDCLEKVHDDVLLITDACLENRQLQVILKNPTIKPLLKRQIIVALFGECCQELSVKFLSLIITKRREIHLLSICDCFLEIYRKEHNIKTVELVLAQSIDEEFNQQIKKHLQTVLQSDIYLVTKINPKILGGFCLTIEGKQYDASFLKKLSILKKEFLVNLNNQ
ncbi:MAG: ATP synthase F1 subunit delta [Bacteroidales bacterium]|nr:ATP synthase F1 subunit delta [Bacteroidales bacterium]